MKRVDKQLLKDVALLILIILFGIAIYSRSGKAQELRLLDSDELSMDVYKLERNVDPFFNDLYADYTDNVCTANPDCEFWRWGVTARFNLVMLEYGNYKWTFNNAVDGMSTNRQFRSVEWRYRTEITAFNKVGVFYDHLSRHVLDAEVPSAYPNVDKYGISLTFIKR